MTTIISDEAVNIALNTWLGGVPAWRNNATERLRTEMRAALTAALPFLPVQGAVKKLEWVAHKGDQHCKIAWTCEGIGGWYAIEHRHEGHFDMWTPNNPDGGRFITLEAAKAAAQDDYQARILSALEPSAARELALEEVKTSGATDVRGLIKTYANAAFEQQGKDIPKYIWHLHFEEFATAIRALSSPDQADAGKVEGDGWRPIESAPKDGTVIDLWSDEYGRLTDCYWGAPMAYEGGETGWVHAHSNEWAESPDEFVHWRHLPSAPSGGDRHGE